MKKLFIMMVLVMAAIAVNAQRSIIKTTDLPKAVTDYITKDYSGFAITEATKVLTNNVTTYEVSVVKGNMKDVLSFNNDGKFIKKVASKGGAVMKKHTTPMTHSKPPVKK